MRAISCTSASADETRAIAAEVASVLLAGDVVVLAGDLGAGKTCFVQGAASALGVEDRVSSPSFVLVRQYRGRIPVVHADVYRLNSLQELIDLGYEDVFDDDRVSFVEWGDAVSPLLPDTRLEIAIRRLDDDRRSVEIAGFGPAWGPRLEELQPRLGKWVA